jgi:CDP-glucose 4,6-dehydratase
MGFGKSALEDLVNIDPRFWRDRSILVTGHTGFKGSWLTLWLHQLGAKIHGYALDPPTVPSLFEAARIKSILASDTRADLADLAALKTVFKEKRPEVVFHLAAQPLVRESYRDPLETLRSNVIGTAHVLEAVRAYTTVRAAVLITTDKVYENREWDHPYREDDPLGGLDPYSASKAAAEIVAASYRASFFGGGARHPAHVAMARAGNVIGGGDWAQDRLLPDCMRAFAAGESVRLRFPQAMRPWQHVLEPLAGYLQLATKLLSHEGGKFARAWNFGPDAGGDATVQEIVKLTARLWGTDKDVELVPASENPHEAGTLRLDSTLARSALDWRSRWSLGEALDKTVAWHKAWMQEADMATFSIAQIGDYNTSGQE